MNRNARNMDKKPYDNNVGDSGPNLEGLSDMYYDPEGHNVLPFLHNYT
jgi:hypothetical protein